MIAEVAWRLSSRDATSAPLGDVRASRRRELEGIDRAVTLLASRKEDDFTGAVGRR